MTRWMIAVAALARPTRGLHPVQVSTIERLADWADAAGARFDALAR